MTLLVRLVPDRFCTGCAARGYVEQRTLLCCSCFGLKIAIEERKRKLTLTLAGRFAHLAAKVREFRETFHGL